MSESVKPKDASEAVKTVAPAMVRGRSPDLSRLLSVSSIIVALVVAGSLALEGVLSRRQVTQVPNPIELAETSPQPDQERFHADKQRVQHLEQRLSLLERQIIFLQTQISSEQKQSNTLHLKIASLENAVAEANIPVAERQVVANLPEAQPEPTAPVAEPPVEVMAPELPDAESASQDVIVTGSINPAPDSAVDETPQVHPASDTIAPEAVAPETAATETAVTETVVAEPAVAEPVATETAAAETLATEAVATETVATETVAADTAIADTVVTGSVNPREMAKPATTPDRELAELVKPAVRNTVQPAISRTRFGVALDLHTSIDAVKAAWKALNRTHGRLVGTFDARALPQGTEDGDLVYRLMVGPIENVADAARHCARMTKSGLRCRTAVFGGEPLDTPPSPGTLIKVEVVADDGEELPLQPLPDPKFAALSAKLRNLVANAPLPQPKPRPSS